jgi:putative endonuclease
MYYTYLLKLSNNDYYAGSTDNLQTRLNDHNEGKNISTKAFRPVVLVYYCAFPTKSQAIKFELYLKSGSGKAFRNRHLVKLTDIV